MLTVIYWLHLAATVAWIGGLAAAAWIILPAARARLDDAAYTELLTAVQTRLQSIGWFSLAVLTLTGMFQMSASPAYEGFLAISNNWSVAILSKHIVIGLMVLVSGYITWGLLPTLKRSALQRLAGRSVDEEKLARLRRQETWLLRLNLALSIVVLMLTAWARASV